MEVWTANKIHKEYACNRVPFKEWIETEKSLFMDKPKKSNFITYLNRKYRLLGNNFLNANWQERWDTTKEWLEEHKDEVISTAAQIAAAKQKAEQDAENGTPTPSKKILGMPKGLVIAGVCVIAVGLGFGIYKIVTRKK